MDTSYPGKRAGSVAETNYFLRLYGSFHPVYRFICLLESLKNQKRISFYARAFQQFSSRLVSAYMGYPGYRAGSPLT